MQRRDADSEPRSVEVYRPKRPLPPDVLQPIESPVGGSGLSAIRKELEYYPSEYYDDRTIQIHTLLKNPFLNHLVMRLGFDDDRDMIMLAISVNGENLSYASNLSHSIFCHQLEKPASKELGTSVTHRKEPGSANNLNQSGRGFSPEPAGESPGGLTP